MLYFLCVQGIPVVYFEKEEFPEMEAFMTEVAQTYGFEFVTYSVSYKDGMQNLVDSHGVKVRTSVLYDRWILLPTCDP